MKTSFPPLASDADFEPLTSEKPTRARLGVLAFLCSLLFVLYLDRVCMSQAVKPIQDEMGLGDRDMAFVLMAFTLAYGIFELPAGHMGDRFGARITLARIVIWWSAFTALTGACSGFWSLILVRFLFGAGEAGAMPNTVRVVNLWFPIAERGRIQGLLMACALAGGTISPALAGYLIAACGWRWTFVIFGSVGVVWTSAFIWWFRDLPSRHRSANKAEQALILAGDENSAIHQPPRPWGQALANPIIWLLGLIMTCASFNSYFYFSWYPKYLQDGRGVSNIQAGWLASLALAGGAIGSLFGGWLADWAARKSADPARFRGIYCPAIFLVAAAMLIASVKSDDPVWSAVFASLSCMALHTQLPFWWNAAAEAAGSRVGALFGLMNGMGVFGAMSSQYFFGAFAEWRKTLGFLGRDRFDPAFYAYAVVISAGAVCWLIVRRIELATANQRRLSSESLEP